MDGKQVKNKGNPTGVNKFLSEDGVYRDAPFINYATNKGWVVAGNIDQVGFYGGDFVKQGGNNSVTLGTNPFGLPAYVWNGTPAASATSGFNKTITNIKSNANYLVGYYFKVNVTSGLGTLYFGNGVGYFMALPTSSVVNNEWYCALAVVSASTEVNTISIGGVYRLSTGEKVNANLALKMNVSDTSQPFITFLLNNSGVQSIQFANPFFTEITSDIGDIFYVLGIKNQFPFLPDKITITPPVGTSMVYNLQRPYKFVFSIIFNDGLTIVAQPSATVAANTAANLTLTNATVGKSITVQILQIS